MPTGIRLAIKSQAYKRLGDRIRQSRLSAGLTQENLASLTGLGHDAVSRLELGRSRVEVMVLVKLAEALCQDVNALLSD